MLIFLHVELNKTLQDHNTKEGYICNYEICSFKISPPHYSGNLYFQLIAPVEVQELGSASLQVRSPQMVFKPSIILSTCLQY